MQVLQVTPRRIIGWMWLGVLLFWLLALGGGNAITARVHAAGQPKAKVSTQIQINTKSSQGKLPPNAFGIWLGNTGKDLPEPLYFYRTPEGIAKLADVGPGSLYYATDLDNWAAPHNLRNAVPIIYPEWMPTDEYLNLSHQVNAEPIIAANVTITCQQKDPLATPSPQNVKCAMAKPKLTVDWIKYLKTLGAPVTKVVLGGEPYAGCVYWTKGIDCTNVSGQHKIALSQDDYAARVVKWAKQIKKANPAIKIGVHLQPNTYLCRNTGNANPAANDAADLDISSSTAAQVCGGKAWDQTVLEKAGKYVDFVVVHQYFVLTGPTKDEAMAQKLSYYQEQRNMRVWKNGATAFPSQIRQELLNWLPAKKNVPIVVAEFNVSYLELASVDERYQARQGLYTGMALGEAFLDLLQPVQTSAGKLNGASNVILLGMFAPQLTLTRTPDLLNAATSTFYLPSWYIMSMLKPLAGKTILKTSVVHNPTTKVKRPALTVYAVKDGKQEWIVVFNHHTKLVRSDIVLSKGRPLSATVTQLGQTGSGFMAMNDPLHPTAMTPQAGTVPTNQLTKKGISKFVFPAHSVTVLAVRTK